MSDKNAKKKICIVGSGNWGSVIAKIVGNNVLASSDKFEKRVTMYVYEEVVDGQKLTDIINTNHENVKYLPGHKIPSNVVAISDVAVAADGCNVLIFVVPHQFVVRLCGQIKGKLSSKTIAISLIKGFDVAPNGGIDLISSVIRSSLNIPCAVLMGANIANEVAQEQFCESTLGCKDESSASLLRQMFQTPYFRISWVKDESTVEVCGALKNIVAVGVGFLDGLDYGENTKAAVIRLGLMEMIRFCDEFYPGASIETFFESCGVADLITTCFGGRNRKVGEAFARTGKTIPVLEHEMLNGQKLQGPPTAKEVCHMLKEKNKLSEFPLFVSVHKVCQGETPVKGFLDTLKNHPEHMTRK